MVVFARFMPALSAASQLMIILRSPILYHVLSSLARITLPKLYSTVISWPVSFKVKIVFERSGAFRLQEHMISKQIAIRYVEGIAFIINYVLK